MSTLVGSLLFHVIGPVQTIDEGGEGAGGGPQRGDNPARHEPTPTCALCFPLKQLRAYPNRPDCRYVIKAQAKWRNPK